MLAFTLSLATLILVGYMVWPALKGVKTRWEFSDEDTPLGRLSTRKGVLVGNLADLDFEFAMGKLSEDDYRSLRDSLKNQTLVIMEQIDVLTGGAAPATEKHTAEVVEGVCGTCSGEVPPTARFCPHCGNLVGGAS